MYLVGADHPHKVATRALLDRLIVDRQRLVTDVEVVQEILHRYAAIDRRDAIQVAVGTLLDLVDDVFPVTVAEALRARDLVLANLGLSARDAIHVAVMEAQGISRILSFDRGFDGVPGVSRVT